MDGPFYAIASPPYEGPYELTPTEAEQVLPMEGFKAVQDVTIHAIPSEYVIPSGTAEIESNGTFDVRLYASATVDVPTGLDGDLLGYGVSTQPIVGTARVDATVLGV